LKVYLAAPWTHRDFAPAWAKAFTDAGHTITLPWWEHPETDKPEELQNCAIDDFTAVVRADVLVLFNTQLRGSETSGKAVETGIALAHIKPIILIGERTNVFHHMPNVYKVATITEALELLDEDSGFVDVPRPVRRPGLRGRLVGGR